MRSGRQKATNAPVTLTPNHEPSFWLAAQLRSIITDMSSGETTHCGHLHAQSQQPGIVAVWRPRLIVCEDCQHQLTVTDIDDKSCDRCHQHFAHGLTTGAIRPHPTLIVLFGLCDACHAKEAAK